MWRESNLPQGREGWVRSPSYSSHLYAAVCTASWNPPTEERGATARRGRGLSPAQTAFLCLQHGPPGGLGTVSVCCAHSAPLSPVLSPPGDDVELPGASPVLTVLVWAFWVRSPGPLVVPYLPASRPALPGACTSRRVQPGLIITAAFVKPWEVSVPWKERLLDDTIANHRLDTFLRRSMLLSQGLER